MMENLILSLMLMVFISEIDGDPRYLTAVSNFKSLTQFYRDTRNAQRPSDEAAEDLIEKKKSVCLNITSSHYFSAMGVEPINPEFVFKKLIHPKHKETFYELFREGPENVDQSATQSHLYTNEYNLKKIELNLSDVVDEVFDFRPPTSSRAMGSDDISHIGGGRNYHPFNKEYVFVCLTKKRSTPLNSPQLALQKWYVSKEYEMNEEGEHLTGTSPIVGRFIFEKGTSSTLKLVAVAEEAAEPYFLQHTHEEDYYVSTLRDGHEPAKESSADPLCNLITEPDRHARLCTAVFSASIFVNRMVETAETRKLLESKCSRLKVTFKMPSMKNRTDMEEHFEWMVACRAKTLVFKEIVQYNISRAYKPNTAIIYDANTPGVQSVVSIFGNVNIPD